MESVITTIKEDLGKAIKKLAVLTNDQIMNNQSSKYDLRCLILMQKACEEAFDAIDKIKKEVDLLIKEE
mgnify:CR=1 FL=1